jgi:hypothetical protein
LGLRPRVLASSEDCVDSETAPFDSLSICLTPEIGVEKVNEKVGLMRKLCAKTVKLRRQGRQTNRVPDRIEKSYLCSSPRFSHSVASSGWPRCKSREGCFVRCGERLHLRSAADASSCSEQRLPKPEEHRPIRLKILLNRLH